MCRRVIVIFVYSALSLIGASGFAVADTIGRYECNYVGTVSQEPIGANQEASVPGRRSLIAARRG